MLRKHVVGACLALAGAGVGLSALSTWQVEREGPGAPFMACFDPASPPSKDMMAYLNQLMASVDGQNYYQSSRWSGTAGSPRSLRWSFVPDGTLVPGLSGPTSASNLFATMDAYFGGNRALWISQFQACFDRWAVLTGTSYTRITYQGNDWDDGASFPSSNGSSTRGDCRISGRTLDGAGSVLAFNYFPSQGDMVIDTADAWGTSTNNYRFLRDVVMHEHGHGLGLQHVCSSTHSFLMEPFVNTSFDGPQHDDIRGIFNFYGDAYEANNTAATATDLGTIGAGSSLNPSAVPAPAIASGTITAIDVASDSDYFKVTTTTPLLVSVYATPIGITYDDTAQASDGSCPSTNTSNSLIVGDLAFDVRASDGTTNLQSVNSTGVGSAETMTGILLSPPGAFYVRVYATNSPAQSQLYNLLINGTVIPTLSASDGTIPGAVRLTWTDLIGESAYAVYRAGTSSRAGATLLASLPANTATYDDTTALPGTTYYYWVEAIQGGGGSRPLAGPDSGYFNPAPANDACANAIPVGEGVVNGTSANATNDGQSTCGGVSGTNNGLDVWYAYTANCAGTATFDTDSPATTFDTVLSVHSGCPGTGANTLACNDNINTGNNHSSVSVSVAAGSTYYIRVAGFGGSSGNFALRVTGPSPANDLCASALPVGDGSYPFSNCGAGTDGPAEAGCSFCCSDDQIGADLWFLYTASQDSSVTVDTCSSPLPAFDTRLAVYAGATCPAAPGTAIACSDDACGALSAATFTAAAGQQFLIRVGGKNAARGSAVLRIASTPAGCSATCDYNQDGGADNGDVIELTNDIASGTTTYPQSCKDFNQDGAEDTGDVIDLVNAIASGTCP